MRTALGLLAASLTTGAWLPQIARTHRTRHSDDISWGYLLAMMLGFGTWLIYGIELGELAIIAANVVSLILVGSLIALKVRTSRGLLEDVDPAR